MLCTYFMHHVNVTVFRRIVTICGRKAIHEALVTKAVDFADRPKFYINEVINPNMKGDFSIL